MPQALGVPRHNVAVSLPDPTSQAPPTPNAPTLPTGPRTRVFRARRRVRLGDVTPEGHLRLETVARMLGEVAEDDVEDAGYEEPVGWLVRRTEVHLRRRPLVGDQLDLATFCSGVGPRWAERTTVITHGGIVALWAISVWVAVDPLRGRPASLGPQFHHIYGPSAGGRKASARLGHLEIPPGLVTSPWPLRRSDLDVNGHVHNTVHWAAVEDAAWGPRGESVACGVVEYHHPLVADRPLQLGHRHAGHQSEIWFLQDQRGAATARLWWGALT